MRHLTVDIFCDAPPWRKELHPRGQPKNKGEFAKKGGAAYGSKTATARPAANQQSGQHRRAPPAPVTGGRQQPVAANPTQQPAANRTASAGNAAQHGRAVAFKPVTDANTFYRAITAAKSANPTIGAAVHAYEPDEYAGMRMFLTPDHTAGFALKGDDIVSVFKHPDSPHQQVARHALELAIKHGGRRLDCFDTVLPYFYSNNHFRAVARTKFADEYAPEGWDYKGMAPFNNGRPDVVFMAYDPNHKQLYKPGDGKLVDDYDTAQMIQEDAVKQRKPAGKAQRIHQLLHGL